MRLRPGLRPNSAGGAYRAPPDPLAAFKRLLRGVDVVRWKGRRKGQRKGRDGKESGVEEMGGEGTRWT